MPRPFTGKTHTGIRRVVRPNGDVYVYQRVTQYDSETRKTKTIKSTLLGILDPKTGKTRPTRGKSEKKEVVVFSFVNSLMYPGFEIPLHRACAI